MLLDICNRATISLLSMSTSCRYMLSLGNHFVDGHSTLPISIVRRVHRFSKRDARTHFPSTKYGGRRDIGGRASRRWSASREGRQRAVRASGVIRSNIEFPRHKGGHSFASGPRGEDHVRLLGRRGEGMGGRTRRGGHQWRTHHASIDRVIRRYDQKRWCGSGGRNICGSGRSDGWILVAGSR